MRIFPVLLVCLALATCSSHLLLPQVTTPAQPGLRDLSSVQLIAVSASNDSQAPTERAALLTGLQAAAPPPVLAAVLDTVRPHLSPRDWGALNSALSQISSS